MTGPISSRADCTARREQVEAALKGFNRALGVAVIGGAIVVMGMVLRDRRRLSRSLRELLRPVSWHRIVKFDNVLASPVVRGAWLSYYSIVKKSAFWTAYGEKVWISAVTSAQTR